MFEQKSTLNISFTRIFFLYRSKQRTFRLFAAGNVSPIFKQPCLTNNSYFFLQKYDGTSNLSRLPFPTLFGDFVQFRGRIIRLSRSSFLRIIWTTFTRILLGIILNILCNGGVCATYVYEKMICYVIPSSSLSSAHQQNTTPSFLSSFFLLSTFCLLGIISHFLISHCPMGKHQSFSSTKLKKKFKNILKSSIIPPPDTWTLVSSLQMSWSTRRRSSRPSRTSWTRPSQKCPDTKKSNLKKKRRRRNIRDLQRKKKTTLLLFQ